jgi:hypothetical protein
MNFLTFFIPEYMEKYEAHVTLITQLTLDVVHFQSTIYNVMFLSMTGLKKVTFGSSQT